MLLLFMLVVFILISNFIKSKIDAYFYSVVIGVGYIYCINELLSIGNNLNKRNLVVVYLITIICIIVYILKNKIGSFKNSFRNSYLTGIIIENKKFYLSLLLFFLVVFFMGLFTIPHSVDSLTYGMTRIAYWNQNQSVAHFATNDVRAVCSPPMAEFINLQLYILHNEKDNFFTLLQTTSYITNTVLIGLICKKLNLSSKNIAIGILLFISMPIAFAEAFTTQVEQFATLWLLIFIYYILDFTRFEFKFELTKVNIYKVLLLGACIAFGYLSKPSIMFAMLIFALWLLILCLKRKDSIKVMIILILLAVFEIATLVFPELYRNFCTFHAFSAPSVGAKHMIDTLHPGYIFLNLLKNLSVNIPNIYFPWMGNLVVHIVYWLAFIMKIDLNDTKIAHDGAEFFLRDPGHSVYDSAVNPTILFMSCGVVFWLIWNRIIRKPIKNNIGYCYSTIFSFLLFCVTLKYEWYSTRYMLSYFALACPMIAIMFEELQGREFRGINYLKGVVIFVCLVELSNLFLFAGERTIRHMGKEDRFSGYFESRKDDENAYYQLSEYLNKKDYQNLGVYFAWRAGEYPLWKMINSTARIEAVNVQNETSIYIDEEFIPEFIVVKDIDGNDIKNYRGNCYSLVEEFDEKIYLYQKQ